MTAHEVETVMAKRTKLSPTMPREVFLHIAQFIPDEASFLAYIGAFQGTTIGQGPMDALWRLTQATPRPKVWPHLELLRMTHHQWKLAVQAIPVFATVHLRAERELHRLVHRVSPSTNLVVTHRAKPDRRRMRKWFRQLAQLPVRGLVYFPDGFIDRMPMAIQLLCNVWPSLTNLRSLELLVDDQASLKAICKCIATSQITELALDGQEIIDVGEPDVDAQLNVEGAVCTDLVAWLKSTKVVRFDLYKFNVICEDGASMQAFNCAMAASDAMTSMTWERCPIRFSAPLVLPPRLQNLSFVWCSFDLVDVEESLTLLANMPDLTHVRFDQVSLCPDALASVLPQSKISHLHLEGCFLFNDVSHDSIQRLADAVEATASLRGLNLAENQLGFDGVKTILEAVERRPYVTDWVNLRTNNYEGRHRELEDIVNTRMPPHTNIFLTYQSTYR